MKAPRHTSTTRGFSRAATLMQTSIRKASEERGFAVTRLLSHWAEVVGEGTARIATPVNVSYSKGGMGATLTLLTTGAQAPMLEMQKEQIRDTVNACYGYNAVSRIHLTQTAATGFAEGQAVFAPAPKSDAPRPVPPQVQARAHEVAEGVRDEGLRHALEALAQNILSRRKTE